MQAVEVANKFKDRVVNAISAVASAVNEGLGGIFRWTMSSVEATPLGHLSRFVSYLFNQLSGSEENPIQSFINRAIGQIDATTSLHRRE